jgi:hypothetical protein
MDTKESVYGNGLISKNHAKETKIKKKPQVL